MACIAIVETKQKSFKNIFKKYKNYKTFVLFYRICRKFIPNSSKWLRSNDYNFNWLFIWLVRRVEAQAKFLAISTGPSTFTVVPADDLKNRA